MRAFAERIKKIVKAVTGRRYERWVRGPYVSMRTIGKGAFSNLTGQVKAEGASQKRGGTTAVFLEKVIGALRGRHSESWMQHLAPLIARNLQVRVLNFRNKISWRPVLWVICPTFETFVGVLERYYRGYYRRFGIAVNSIKRDTLNRHGLLLVSGTLGSGGSERQTVLTVLGLARRNLESVGLAVVYLRSEAERFYLHRLEAAGMPVIEFSRDISPDRAAGMGDMLGAVDVLPEILHDVAAYARTIAQQSPAIVHLWLDEVNVKGGLAAVAAGVPRVILSGRNLPPNNYLIYKPYMREAYRWLLRQPGVTLINNSGAGARAYERWLDLPEGSVRVAHNGFDFDEELLERCRRQRAAYRERHGIPQAVPLVGTVMRFNEEKRPLLWAEIAARVGKALPEAHFLVVGDGPLREQLEARVAQPDLAGRLHLVGIERQPLEAMAAMDLFLLSSRGEGLPNVLVEAQAVGVPVVTTRVGGAPETLDAGRTGWVLSSDKTDRAAAEIVRLLGDNPWLQTARKAGPDFVKKNFGLERMLDETLEIYGDSISSYATAKKRASLENKSP